jgi:hypothetical protein
VFTASDYDYAFYLHEIQIFINTHKEFLTGTAAYFSLLLVSTSNGNKVESSNMTNVVNVM